MSPIEALKGKAREWAASVVELHNTPYPVELQGEKDKLLNRAKTIKTGIEKIFGTIDELAPIAQIQELGAVPILVPAAIIAASSAAIAKWYYDAKKLEERKKTYDSLRTGGLTHNQALNVVDGKGGFLEQSRKLLIPVGLGLAGYLFFIKRR